jgi:DNA repair exonuclease SbcCD ATPase subunit
MTSGQIPAETRPDGDEPGVALRDLGRAGERALQVIRQATASGDGGTVSAIEAVILLDDALQSLSALQTAVPELLSAARPGSAVEPAIRAGAAELSGLGEQVSAARRELDLASAGEQQTRNRLAELSALKAQVDELRRLERLVAVLDGLNEQRQVIEERLTMLRQLTGGPEQAIAAGAGEVIKLAEDRRALLAPHVRDALTRAGEALRSLASDEESVRAERERLSAAQQRHAEFIAERDERLAQLAAHARADSALAAALSAIGSAPGAAGPREQLRAMLEGVSAQLTAVDDALRDTLASGQDDYDREHAFLTWSDQGPGSG